MLYCDFASAPAVFDDLLVLVDQLRRNGVDAAIPSGSAAGKLGLAQDYAAHALSSERPMTADDRLLLIGAQQIPDERLAGLRAQMGELSVPTVATGRFETPGALIAVKGKLSYVLGRTPEVMSLEDPLEHTAPILAFAGRPATGPRPTVLLVYPPLESEAESRALVAFAGQRQVRTVILTDGKGKNTLSDRHGNALTVYHLGEILPAALTRDVGIAVMFNAPGKSYRLNTITANLAASGAVLLDATRDGAWAGIDADILPAPTELPAIAQTLSAQVLPGLAELQAEMREGALARRFAASRLTTLLDAPQAAPARAIAPARPSSGDASPAPRRILFVPTNGVGLGHAQRTSLIATEMDETVSPLFAAFPSCMKMLQNYGFDTLPLVSRSGHHAREHENDLVNYARIAPTLADCAGLVFDGGYVFGSIYHPILDSGKPGVWIRRGLWQEGQNNTVALDREKAFSRVIVPAEAFEELNQAYSRNDRLHGVGPIVQTSEDPDGTRRAALRRAIAERFGVEFDHLVVTMLGGGVAADRSALTTAAAALMDRRARTLNLVVVWPTATVEPSAFGWKNTRVVKTHHAHGLVTAADLYISAVGYNSFHEAMYNAVPTIFVPQMASYMDDQAARARAAVDRGLAHMIEPHQVQTLGLRINTMLDGEAQAIRDRLRAQSLPEPGNRAAARLIEEVCP